MTSKKKIKCTKCGKCCTVLVNGKWEDCPYLIRYMFNRTRCSIYHHRMSAIIAKDPLMWCIPRFATEWDYPRCPFNTDKPMHPAYINKEVTT